MTITFTKESITKVFYTNWISRLDVPYSVIKDRGNEFRSLFVELNANNFMPVTQQRKNWKIEQNITCSRRSSRLNQMKRNFTNFTLSYTRICTWWYQKFHFRNGYGIKEKIIKVSVDPLKQAYFLGTDEQDSRNLPNKEKQNILVRKYENGKKEDSKFKATPSERRINFPALYQDCRNLNAA